MRNSVQEVFVWIALQASTTPKTDVNPENCAAFPRIAAVAPYVLSHTMTAVCCESVFSIAGILSDRRRNRIGAKRLDMQLFEHWNRRFGQATQLKKGK